MNHQRKIELQRAIAKIENPYPKDDLILGYGDFLKVRIFLHYYQFNPVVFAHLLEIANDEWRSEKRINRLSLLQTIKQYLNVAKEGNARDYYSTHPKRDPQLSAASRKLLFELFKKTFTESRYVTNNQIETVRKIGNNILMDLALTPEEEEWLCANVSLSEMILNRVLRYPAKSEVISDWAKRNFNHDDFKSRRAELLSRIIDQKPDFEIDQQTLVDDFEWLNQQDLQAIQNYNDERMANNIIERELGAYFPKTKTNNSIFSNDADHGSGVELSEPELKLFKRPYNIPIDRSQSYPVPIPDFVKMREHFYANLSTHHKITMIWAIAHSKLSNEIKSDLLKKYYCDKTYHYLHKVCDRTKNPVFLKWVLEQQ